MTGEFRNGHKFVSGVDAGGDGVPAGEGGHRIQGVVTLASEAHCVQLDHEVVRELPVHHLAVELLIRRQSGDGTLNRMSPWK